LFLFLLHKNKIPTDMKVKLTVTLLLILSNKQIHAQQRIGIGTSTPAEKLEVAGNIKADTIKSNFIKMSAGASAGYLLTSDGLGNATWQVPPASSGGNLNDAYNNGGAGAGRIVTANTGALLVNGTDGLQVTGSGTTGVNLALSGSGTRMFFYPKKAAFRAGNVTASHWDNDSIGNYSVAMGLSTIAKGPSSTALGSGTIASGTTSTALGFLTQATGTYSTALGYQSFAIGTNSTAFGNGCTASNTNATAFGNFSQATAITSIAGGFNCRATANFSVALGRDNNATGTYSLVVGQGSDASGESSIAIGNACNATATNAMAIGHLTNATNSNAFAFGASTRANGVSSTAGGRSGAARGMVATSIGENTIANGFGSFVIGHFNASVSTTPLFIIGNGTSSTARSNAMMVRKDGYVGIGTNIPNNLLEVNGAFGTAIITTTADLTLTDDHHTVIILSTATAGNGDITLPSYTVAKKRIYVIVNQASVAKSISGGYRDFSGANVTSIPANSSITIQSEPTIAWFRIR
jgi:trimeric autotransporter adhesin